MQGPTHLEGHSHPFPPELWAQPQGAAPSPRGSVVRAYGKDLAEIETAPMRNPLGSRSLQQVSLYAGLQQVVNPSMGSLKFEGIVFF